MSFAFSIQLIKLRTTFLLGLQSLITNYPYYMSSTFERGPTLELDSELYQIMGFRRFALHGRSPLGEHARLICTGLAEGALLYTHRFEIVCLLLRISDAH